MLIRERGERERIECRALNNKNTSPKPLMMKMRGVDYCKFLQVAELRD